MLGLGLIPERRWDLNMQESQHEELQAQSKLVAGYCSDYMPLLFLKQSKVIIFCKAKLEHSHTR